MYGENNATAQNNNVIIMCALNFLYKITYLLQYTISVNSS